MAGNSFSMDDYIDVAERIQDFMDATGGKGSLQRVGEPQVMVVEGTDAKTGEAVKKTFIVYTAAAYRHEQDEKPGIGTAWEPFPGPTQYTRDSELQNAETAAWGRAIVALGLTANRKIASRQEVRARLQEKGEEVTPAKVAEAKTIDAATVKDLARLYKASGWKEDGAEDPHATLRMQLTMVDADNQGDDIPALIKKLTVGQAETLKKALEDA